LFPGILTSTEGGICTTNFLFVSEDNLHIYLGTAAHCFVTAPDSGSACNETTVPFPLGTTVDFLGPDAGYVAWQTGTPVNETVLNVTGALAYTSWGAMLEAGEDPYGLPCGHNDFALVEIPLGAQTRTTPYTPHFGPVTELAKPEELAVGTLVQSYGNSPLWVNQEPAKEKRGIITEEPKDETDNWFVLATMAPPGVFGDSGSGLMTADHKAVGILSRFAETSGNPSAAGVGTGLYTYLGTALAYMEAHGGPKVHLAQL
jgi:hypothetical protein